MKKNILRVFALVLAAAMLVVCASCSQEIKIRLVDSNGNDIDISSLQNKSVPVYQSAEPATQKPANNNPAPADADKTPAENPDANPDETPAENPDETPAPVDADKVPETKEEILDFYKAAVNNVKQNGAAGYNKQEWQDVGDINIIGVSALDNAIKDVAGNYATTKDKAELQVCEKGSDAAKSRFPNFVLTDYSKVKDAKIDASGANYKITIILQDEDTPKSTGSFVKQCTNSVLLWDSDVEPELANISLIQGYSDVHVIYRGFTITAEITKDGKFVNMTHVANVDIKIGSLSVGLNALLKATVKNKSGSLVNTCQYTNFKY